MNPAPLAKVLKVVGAITGKDDRAENLELINGVLEMLYRDGNCRWKYFQTCGCARIADFIEGCRNANQGSVNFKAVVMPVNVQNIRELRVDGTPFRITEERIDPSCFIRNGLFESRRHGCDPMTEHLPPRLLERDVPYCGDSGQVTFRTDCPADIGKLVGLRYLDFNGDEQREDLELNTSAVGTSLSVSQFLEITFPERQGNITVETADGAFLGKYHPSIYIPSHEWFRLSAGCAGQQVHYRGLQTLAPVVFDTDPVVFSDSFYWRLAIKAYTHADSMELTSGQSNGLARIFAQLAQVGQADLESENDNFNATIIPNLAKSTLGTARTLSTRGRYLRR